MPAVRATGEREPGPPTPAEPREPPHTEKESGLSSLQVKGPDVGLHALGRTWPPRTAACSRPRAPARSCRQPRHPWAQLLQRPSGSRGAAGAGREGPGHPSTHPAEGSDQGAARQLRCRAYPGRCSPQRPGGGPEPCPARPTAPPPRAAPPAVPGLSAPAPRAARRLRAGGLCTGALLGRPQQAADQGFPAAALTEEASCRLAGESPPTPASAHPRQQTAEPGLTCRQQFTAHHKVELLVVQDGPASAARRQLLGEAAAGRGAPFSAPAAQLGAAGGHEPPGGGLQPVETPPCPAGLQGGTGKARTRGGGRSTGSSAQGGGWEATQVRVQPRRFTAPKRLTLQWSWPCPHAAHDFGQRAEAPEGGDPLPARPCVQNTRASSQLSTAGSEGLRADLCCYHSL